MQLLKFYHISFITQVEYNRQNLTDLREDKLGKKWTRTQKTHKKNQIIHT